MVDRDQQLLMSAAHYLARLDAGDLMSVEAFAATFEQPLRAELIAYLQEVLAGGQPIEPIVLTPAENMLAERVTARTLARVTGVRLVPAPTLMAVRTARNLSVPVLAQRLNLPADLLARIERGGVAANSLPTKLVIKLAIALEQTEAQIRTALHIAYPHPSGMQLRETMPLYGTAQSSQDNLIYEDAQVVSFADGLAASMATAEQRAEWQRE